VDALGQVSKDDDHLANSSRQQRVDNPFKNGAIAEREQLLRGPHAA
jgi:hypothetical protein